jgi:hypothetical protein
MGKTVEYYRMALERRDTKRYLLMLCSSAGNLLSFAGYMPQKIYEAVKSQQQKSLYD